MSDEHKGTLNDPLVRGRGRCYVPGCPEDAVRMRGTRSGAWVAYCKLHARQSEELFGPAVEEEHAAAAG